MLLKKEVDLILKQRYQQSDKIEEDIDSFLSHPGAINDKNIEQLILNAFLLSPQKFGPKIEKIVQIYLSAKHLYDLPGQMKTNEVYIAPAARAIRHKAI